MKTKEQLEEEIRRLAYQLYEKSGRIPGKEVENWLEAERIILSKYAEEMGGKEESKKPEEKPKKRRGRRAKKVK
jgi:hypothetical protein